VLLVLAALTIPAGMAGSVRTAAPTAPAEASVRMGTISEAFIEAAALTIPASPLASAPVESLKVEVKPTVLFVQDGAVLKQRIDLVIDSTAAHAAASLEVRSAGKSLAFDIDGLSAGRNTISVNIPEILKTTSATFTVTAGKVKTVKTVTLSPQRKWTLYLLPHSHTDIGYTELQSRVARNHVEYLDSVIEFCKATDGYPEEARFRWNIEVAWALENFLKTRPPAKVEALLALLKSGRVELSAWYLNQSDGFGHEELIRSVELARKLSRNYGFPLRAAMNNDVTGFSWAAPQVLSQVGVKWFTTGINETRSRAPLRRPNPFYWESPDGSKILHWNGEHYLFANYDLLVHEGIEKSFPKIIDYLAKLQARGDYPYDRIAFHVSGYVTDNCPPRKELSDRVKEWNARWAYPKLRLATMSEYFEGLEKAYAKTIPTHKLGWPDYWTDGIGSTAYETGLNRLAHGDIAAAETWSLTASLLDKSFAFPTDDIKEAYEQTMLYDEHTWGAHNSISEPESELARGQWLIKGEYAYAAREMARTLASRSLGSIIKRIPNPGLYAMAVFNPLSWERTDMVRTALPAALVEKKGRFKLFEKATGAEISYQIVDKTTLLFQATVPSMGYAVYTITPDVAPAPPAPAAVVGKTTIENKYYKAVVDTVTGGLASLVDKQTGMELVDSKSGFALNQFIYENPVGGRAAVDDMAKRADFKRYSPAAATAKPGLQGPGASSLVVTSKAFRNPEIKQEVILYDGIKRIDIVNTLRKEETFDPEAAYFAFPFKVEGGKMRFEIADGAMTPETEQLPGTTRDWHTVQTWVEAAGAKSSVVWSPIEAPLVQFGDINTGKWLTKLDLKNAFVFSYALNNLWMTNFKASQGGTLVFRYSLTSRVGGADPTASTRFGWETHAPLTAVWLAEKNKGNLPPGKVSFFAVDSPNVVIQAVVPSDRWGGISVRLREIAGQAGKARLTSPLLYTDTVTYLVTDIAENPSNTFKVVPESIYVPFRPYGIHTVVVRPN
ncbi:MAG: glycoside hydrolase family 38 C-terminal domain-containing protein, partial [Acidobacteriota bacterium]|nr:glycoside hydrolase family 38 C-terminal domain-containing protein [Acidobacteriota bacterium]